MATVDTTDVESAELKHRRTAECLRKTREYLLNRIPVVRWLPKYKWREYFLSDFLAGLTLACLHVPQSMAFAVLAQAPPIFGLYTSCFSVFVYCCLGQAHISSVGPVAVASILTGDAVASYTGTEFSDAQLVVTVTFLVGVVYVAAFFLRFDVVTLIFTKPLKSSFLLACCFTIMAKALSMFLGLKFPAWRGYFTLPMTIYRTCKHITETHFITTGLSLSVMAVFIINAFAIKPQMKKCTNFILPVEALVTALSILVSYFLQLKDYGVVVIDDVPSGLPTMYLPAFSAVGQIMLPTMVVAITNFCTSLTLLMLFNEGLDTQQELFALGATNLICCYFGSLPFGNSMMRTAVATTLGLKTLMASIISCLLLFFVILFAGPLFEPLPQAVLACIILFGIGMLVPSLCKQSYDVFRTGKENIFIWVLVFISGLLVDVTLGLFIGLGLTLRQNLATQVEPPEAKELDSSKDPAEQQELLTKEESKK